MKVYFIGGSYDSCYYVRCLVPMLANLWDGDRTSMHKKKSDPVYMMQGAMDADVIVYHRPVTDDAYESAILLQQAGKKIVMDNDDTYRKDSGVPIQMLSRLKDTLSEKLNEMDTKLKRFAKMADMVTVSTEFLSEEYLPYNKNVVVIPNFIDKRDWFKPRKNTTDKVRIGIVGSVASNKDYEPIIPLLDKLKEREDIQLVLFALPEKSKYTQLAVELYSPEFEFWNKYNPEWHHFCPMSEYMYNLNDLRLDIMLIPRYDSYFNRAKSNLKFLEASMCKVPVVAQSFSDGLSPYQTSKQDDKYLLLANTKDEWIEQTEKLIDSKELRDKMGDMAFDYVIENYSITNNKDLWEKAYSTLWNEL